MLAESKWAGTALGWIGLCLCAVSLLSHVFGFYFMTVRCFKSVSPSVTQKDVPEAISTEAFISLVVGGSLFWVTLSLFPFMPESSCHKMGALRVPPSHVLLSQMHQVQISGRFRVGGAWPSGALRAQDLKPGTTEKWLSTYQSLGCSTFQETIQNQWGCFVTRSPISFPRRYLEFLFLWLCYFPVY